MSCNTNPDYDCCTTTPPQTSAYSGKKISQLNELLHVDYDDLYVVVDVSNNETKYATHNTITHYDNSATTLSADTYQDAITELDNIIENMTGIHNELSGLQGGYELSGIKEYYHLDYNEYNTVSAITYEGGIVPDGGFIGQVLTKSSNADYDFNWHTLSGAGSGIPDVPGMDTYIREYGNWIAFNPDGKADVSALTNYTTTADFNSHTSDTTIHYPMSAIEGLVISGGQANQILSKITNTDYDYEWVDNNAGIGDTPNDGKTYIREYSNWVESDIFDSDNYYTSAYIDNMLNNYAQVSAINSLSASIDYNTTNIYNVSASLNNHISATNNPHKTSYLNLIDTDNITYNGFSGYNVIVNHTENGLVFTPPKDSNTNAPYIYRLSNVIISNGEFRTDNPIHSSVNYIYIYKYDNNGLDRSDGLNAIIKSDLISINNGTRFANYKVISNGAYWNGDTAEFAVTPLSNNGVFNDKDEIYVELMFRGANTFDQLSDTPINKVGSAGKVVAVNTTENALEYVSIAIPPLSAVTNIGNITEDDIIVGTVVGPNVTISDGNNGSSGYPGISMRGGSGNEATILFDEPNSRIVNNHPYQGGHVYSNNIDKDYIQRKNLTDAISALPNSLWTSGVSTSGATRLFPTVDYDQVDIGVQGGVDLGGELNVESEVIISGDIEVIGSDDPNADGLYTETSPSSNVWVNGNNYYVYMLDANTWIVSSDNDPTNYGAILAYKQNNISTPVGLYSGYNGHSNISVSDDSGNIYNDAIAAKGSIYASDTIKTGNKLLVGRNVGFGKLEDISDDFNGILLSGKASSTGDKLVVADNTHVVMRIGSDGGVYAPEESISDIDNTQPETNRILTTKEWVLDKLGTSALNNLVKGDEGNGDGYWLITDDRNNKGDIGVGALDFSTNTTASTTHGATGNYSVAFGWSTIASGEGSLAEGTSSAIGDYSHAEGIATKATNNTSHSEGYLTEANGSHSHAEGYSTKADGDSSHAEGSNNVASGYFSHAEGSNTQALNAETHAEGYFTVASGEHSHSEGESTQSIGKSSHAEGYTTEAKGLYSHAEGNNTKAIGDYSHAEGNLTSSTGISSHAEGESTNAFGDNSHAEGAQTKANAYTSHAEGDSTVANAMGSHAEGMFTVTNIGANYSHAEGYYSETNGQYSHAEGSSTKATGISSHAEGSNTKSNGIDSHAEGRETEANGNYSHAEGYQSISDGLYSHAGGENTHSIGTHSHSEGRNTIANGNYSHSEGLVTEANGVGSHSMGYNTHAEGDYSLAIGKYNIGNSDTIFEIGVGDSSGTLNAFQVKNDGKEILFPQLTNTDIDSSTDDSAVTKGWVLNKTSSLSIDDLTDVDTSTATPTIGQLLQWDGTNWVPVDAPSSTPLSGPTSGRPSNAATGLQYFSTDLGYPIYFNGTNWVNGTGAYVIGPN